jgi:hypothetical protein
MYYQRRSETMDVDDEDEIPIFDLPDAPSSNADDAPEWNELAGDSGIQDRPHSSIYADGQVEYEDMSFFKRVIVVEVKMNIAQPKAQTSPYRSYYPFSATPSPARSPSGAAYGYPSPRHHSRHTPSGDAYGYSPRGAFSPRYSSSGYYATAANVRRNKGSWSAPRYESKRPNYFAYRASYGDSDEDEYEYKDYLVDGVIYRVPVPSYKYRGHGNDRYYYVHAHQGSTYKDEPDVTPQYEIPPPRRRRQSSLIPKTQTTRPSSSHNKAALTPKATEADARKHRIPPGYSLKNWDPSEEPIMLSGSVFDANSLGKWIYDWTVYHHGPATPIADMAGELWLLLIQLAGKVKRAEECMPRIRTKENRNIVNDFIESGEWVTDKLKKILKSCEIPMLKAGRKRGRAETPEVQKLGNDATAEAQATGLPSGNTTSSLDLSLLSNASENAEVIIKNKDGKASEGESGKAPRQFKAKPPTFGNNAGIEFVESIFGKDRQLEATEKFMASIRLWNVRFDARCGDILRRPGQ